MKKIIFLSIIFALMMICACGGQEGVASPTGNIGANTDGGNSTPEQVSTISTSPLGSTDEMLSNAKKATDNEWYSDITCVISEVTETEYGEKRLISITFQNATPDKVFISFEFIALLFDADGNPINKTVESVFSTDNIDLHPGGVFDRDQWVVPLEAQQAKVCVKSIFYMDSKEQSWENPFISDWIMAEKDSF